MTLWYLATPYSKYPSGIEQAFRDASATAAQLMKLGIICYSPIAHTHPLAIHGEINPLDHEIWLPFDMAMMARCDGLLIVEMPSWESSYGIAFEKGIFEASGKPVRYVRYPVTTEAELHERAGHSV